MRVRDRESEASFDVSWLIRPAVKDAGKYGKHPRLLQPALITAMLGVDVDDSVVPEY